MLFERLVHLRLVFSRYNAWLQECCFFQPITLYNNKLNLQNLKWTCLFKGIPTFLQEMLYLWHARVAKKNNGAFYKIVFASSKGKKHSSLEESCLVVRDTILPFCLFEGANTLRQTYFLYNKVLLKQAIFEKYSFMLDITFSDSRFEEHKPNL